MTETISSLLVGFALVVLAGCFAAPYLKIALNRLRRQGIAFALIVAGFLVSMATKPAPKPVDLVQVTADAVTGASALAAYTNDVQVAGSSPWTVLSNAMVEVVYRVEAGYLFANGASVITNTVTASEAVTSATISGDKLPLQCEARVSDIYYLTLKAALKSSDDATVTLLKGVTANENLTVSGNQTLETDGFALMNEAGVTFAVQGEMAFKNCVTNELVNSGAFVVDGGTVSVGMTDVIGDSNDATLITTFSGSVLTFSNKNCSVTGYVWAKGVGDHGHKFILGNVDAKIKADQTKVPADKVDLAEDLKADYIAVYEEGCYFAKMNKCTVTVDGVVTNVIYGASVSFVEPEIGVKGLTNFVAAGWSGSTNGIAVVSDPAKTVSFDVRGASEINWLYQTNYWFEATSEYGEVSIATNSASVLADFYPDGTAMSVSISDLSIEEKELFQGWRDSISGELVSTEKTANIALAKAMKLVADFSEPTPVTGGVCFMASEVTGVMGGDPIEVEVYGGLPDRPTQVTVSLQKNTLSSYKAYYNGKKVSFPLTLNWDAGAHAMKVIEIVPTKGRCCSSEDCRFLTLELGSEAGQRLVAPQVCTVTVNPEVIDDDLYVRALPWPANGGRVSGYGVIKTDSYGAVKTCRTLKATANKWATFDGWYAAKADDPNTIDLSNKITDERTLRVGKGTEYADGTFYAYFTDVLAVPAVNLPDAKAEGAKGVWTDVTNVYEGIVGVWFALPVSFEDESGFGTLTVTGLPPGLRYNGKNGFVEGLPTNACEKTVTAVAKNAAGKHTATFNFVINALPTKAIGTWNGVVRELADPEDGTHAGFGTVQFSATSEGKLSAKVATRLTGMKSFSAKGYDLINENVFGIAITNRAGEVFEAVLSHTNDWKTAQLVGMVTGGKFAENDEEAKFTAIRSTCFDKKDGNADALEFLEVYKDTYRMTLYPANGAASGTVEFRVKDSGKVYVKAKGANGTYSSTCAGAFRALPDGALIERALPAGSAAVQTAIRSGKKLWATDTVLGSDDTVGGLACEYNQYGDDAHARVVGE